MPTFFPLVSNSKMAIQFFQKSDKVSLSVETGLDHTRHPGHPKKSWLSQEDPWLYLEEWVE